MNLSTRALGMVLAIGTLGTFVTLYRMRSTAPDSRPVPVQAPPVRAAALLPESITESVTIQRGDTLDDVLGRSGLDAADRVGMISAVKGVFNVKKLRAGSQLTLTRGNTGAAESLEYVIDPDRKLKLSCSAGTFRAAVVEIPGDLRVVPVCGILQSSLFESIERTGERAEVAMQVAEIFGWDLDFYSDPQPGDQFCLLLEKKEYANGQPAAYRRILAARYNNAGTVYEGYLFPDRSGKARYYSADGRSLESAFLRSPLKFEARVSSRFSRRRFHPVLRIYRPHLGTDYAAPVGAPVQAVGSGRVTYSGRSGGAGNMVRIRHENGYESMYLHLSRLFVRAGQGVRQEQRIAAVGSTGLSTGPHLDFRLRRNGNYVDFERLKPPRATRLGAEGMAAFAADRDRFAALLDQGLRSTTTAVANAAPVAAPTGGGVN
ncbi:MAG TPA: peptidoglycan DD-metalloendopeptidase family protein [Bryobacteraceae bacterium]|nr:peptidoglycan DD-metalloendopeptidase family protein [Bryobacteraceae bacterium]